MNSSSVAESVHLVAYLLVTYVVAPEELGVPVAKVLDALLNHPRLSARPCAVLAD